MDKNNYFFWKVELMLRLLPVVAKENCFALKGGTLINFFVRNMHRISVDIDLTYLTLQKRNIFLKNFLKYIHIQKKKIDDSLTKIFVRNQEGVQVTIEPNEVIIPCLKSPFTSLFVYLCNAGKYNVHGAPSRLVNELLRHGIRGSVFPCKTMSVSKKVEEIFENSVEIKVLSLADLYGEKLCTALDRQHPRDLFDVKILLENEGISAEIRLAFFLYLAGQDRPIHEVLNPSFKEIREVYDKEFLGMTNTDVSYEELILSREECLSIIKKTMTLKEKQFLLSIKMGSPQCDLVEIKDVHLFPSIQWKLFNINKMKADKKKVQTDKLKSFLEI